MTYEENIKKELIRLRCDVNDLINLATFPAIDVSYSIEAIYSRLNLMREILTDRRAKSSIDILLDPDRNLLGGFLKKWQEQETLDEPFISEAAMNIKKAIQLIIDYEFPQEEYVDRMVREARRPGDRKTGRARS